MHIDPGKNAQWGADRVIVIGFQGRRRMMGGGIRCQDKRGGVPLAGCWKGERIKWGA